MPILKIIIKQLMKYCKKPFFIIRLILILVVTLNNLYLQGQVIPSREYQLKAVFLFNFTQFVDWPPASYDTEQSPLVIGILGKNPFGTYLEQTVSGEKINGHPVIVRYFENEAEAKGCHLLFLNIPESKKRNDILKALKGKSILTVSDGIDFLEQGGMIRFFTNKNKIKIQINLEASKASELVVSSKLLGVAEIFKP
ncbi:MAG: YfiR family protein [Chitinophagaceae bacterium]